MDIDARISEICETIKNMEINEFDEMLVKCGIGMIKPSIDSEFDINNDVGEMIVELSVRIFENAVANNYPFEMDVVLYGLFKMANDSGESVERYKANAVAILYPYVRALITNYTASANVTPLVLPTINVNKVIEQNKKS